MNGREHMFRNTLRGLLLFLLMLSVLWLSRAWLGGHFRSASSMRTYLDSFGIWGPFVLTVIQALQVILPVLPGFVGCIVGATMFGAARAFWINYIGISAGSIIAYWLARQYGVRLVGLMIPLEKYQGWIHWIGRRKSYSVMLFLAILLPLAPDDFFCYFSGLTNMDAKRFTWIILLAKPWCILFYSLLFSHLGQGDV